MDQSLPCTRSIALLLATAAIAVVGEAQAAPIKTPDKVVVVFLQDRASDAVTTNGSLNATYKDSWPKLHEHFVPGSLVYGNSHGVTHPTLANMVAVYSGSTHGMGLGEDEPGGWNGNGEYFTGANLGKSLFTAGKTFASYAEGLPANDRDVHMAGDATYPDRYTRRSNPAAMFSDPDPVGTVNKTWDEFPQNNFSQLPDVSFVIPDNLHSSHGSNLEYPYGGSADDSPGGNNEQLRQDADAWLFANMKPYLDWAKENNSLLIITQDEERWTGGTSSTITTLVNGDSTLFESGVNPYFYNHYNLLRTLEEWHGLPFIGESANATSFLLSGTGALAVPEPASATMLLAGGLMLLRRSSGRGRA